MRLQLKDAKERSRKCMQMSGEDVLLQKGPGLCRGQRYAPTLEFNSCFWSCWRVGRPPRAFYYGALRKRTV